MDVNSMLSFVSKNIFNFVHSVVSSLNLEDLQSQRIASFGYWLIVSILVFISIKTTEKMKPLVKIVIFTLMALIVVGYFVRW